MALKYLHLIGLASLVAISLVLVIIGGSISAWCIKVGQRFECHSLFHSNENFSCLFKLLPAGVIICLSFSLLMFIILIIIHNAKKEYQLVARFTNILVLSVAIVLIMIVLLQWFHPPSHASKNIIIATVSEVNGNSSQRQVVFSKISSKDPLYLPALEAQQRSMATYRYNINHGPNLFFASFVLLLFTLIIFVIIHFIYSMPVKRRRTNQRRRRRKIQESQLIYLQTSQEKSLQKIDSDIRTIPDQTFGKVYSTQIIEPKLGKSMKRKTSNR